MYLIIGLGNPEEEYSRTRHNMGFDTINKLAEKYGIKVNKNKFNSLYGSGEIEGEKVILLKPQTYMNLSGTAIRETMNFYKLSSKDIIVIYDDLDIEPGAIKIRKKGGPGTHNGMKSVVHEIGTEDFARIRVGIGMPQYKNLTHLHNQGLWVGTREPCCSHNKNDLLNFILTKIPEEEYKVLETAIQKAAEAIGEIIKKGIDSAMNQYN